MTRRRTGNFPAPLTEFVGRVREVDAIRQRLSATRLLTLSGAGGVGKTRLALRLAAGAQRAFDGGIWWVDLAQVRSPELVGREVATSLGLLNQSDQGIDELLVEHVAERNLMLVLDNCEHLTSACAELAVRLLRAAPELRIVTTSRFALGVTGELVYRVPPLPVPDDDATAREIDSCDAVRLWHARAAAVDGEYVAATQPRAELLRLLRRLDGLPLAIELAAARVASMSVPEIHAQLERDADRLLDSATSASADVTNGDVTSAAAVDRQQVTMRATIDRSYQLCTSAERAVWERASVFPGTFDIDAAQAVCEVDGVRRGDVPFLIDRLVNKNIIHRADRESRFDSRYRLMWTIADYGLDRLAERGEVEVAGERLRDHVRRLVADAADDWCSPREVRWQERLRLDRPNLYAALTYCADRGDTETRLEIVTDVVRARSYFWCGELRQGVEDIRRAVDAVPTPSAALRATALALGTWIALCRGDSNADAMLAEAIELAGQGDEPIPEVMFARGLRDAMGGDRAGIALLRQSYDGLRASPDRVRSRGTALMALMMLNLQVSLSGTAEEVESINAEATAAHAGLGVEWYVAWIRLIHTMGRVRHCRDVADAMSVAEQAREDLRLIHHCGDIWGELWGIRARGFALAAAGAPRQAVTLLGAAARLDEQVGMVDLARMAPVDAMHQTALERIKAELSPEAVVAAYDFGYAIGDHADIVELGLGEPEFGPTVVPASVSVSVPGASADSAARSATDSAADSAAHSAAYSALTPRQREVAALVAQGLSNREIASRLVVSVRTVTTHLDHVRRALDCDNRSQVAHWWHRNFGTQAASGASPVR